MARQLFISYSHRDRRLVVPVVKLLRASTAGWVFQDDDTLVPGQRWRPQADTALRAAHLIVVFWCWHARRSTEVAREYQEAIALGKEILPVWLDGTPLPATLQAFHWIDFSTVIAHRRHFPAWAWNAIAGVLLVGGWTLMNWPGKLLSTDEPTLWNSSPGLLSPWMALLLAFVVGVCLFCVRMYRRRKATIRAIAKELADELTRQAAAPDGT
jgi:hypothetical protein